MDARLNLFDSPVGAKLLRHINSAGQVVSDSTLPAATQELVKIRASQINGCGFCTDMHTKDAAHAGETSTRPPATTSPASSDNSDNEEYLAGTAGAVSDADDSDRGTRTTVQSRG